LAKGRGGGKTPERLVELLKKAVGEKSQSAVSKETGLGLATINSYLNGIGEPTTKTLQKLADYFDVSIAELRGEDEWIYRSVLDVQKNNLDKVIRSVRAKDFKNIIYSLRKMIVSDIRLNPQRSEEEAIEEITLLAGEILKRIITKEYSDMTNLSMTAKKIK
jgi:transcriptional regulator with XRE-family HTH domain